MSEIQELLHEIREVKALLLQREKPPASASADVADAVELDSEYGDPLIKYNPKGWDGASLVGKNFSHCTPAELDAIARDRDSYAAWADRTGAVDNKGRPKSYYAKKDARLARGWAKKMRAAEDLPSW